MNKFFLSSVLAIVMTIVLGFSVFYLFILDSNDQVNSDVPPTHAIGEKSNHPYPPPSMDDIPSGEEAELIIWGKKPIMRQARFSMDM